MSIIENFVKLEDICVEYFGMSRETSIKRAGQQLLPVPAIRLVDSQKAPYFVTRESLDKYVEQRTKAAVKLHSQMAGV